MPSFTVCATQSFEWLHHDETSLLANVEKHGLLLDCDEQIALVFTGPNGAQLEIYRAACSRRKSARSPMLSSGKCGSSG